MHDFTKRYNENQRKLAEDIEITLKGRSEPSEKREGRRKAAASLRLRLSVCFPSAL